MNLISVAMSVMLTNLFYCTSSKRTLPQWHMASADPPGIMFVGFFREKCLPAMDKYIMIISVHLHCWLLLNA